MGTRYRTSEEGVAFFITTTANKFMDICQNEQCYRIIAEAIKLCLAKYELKLLAYIIMPNHVHLVVFGDGRKISDFMRDFKRGSAVRIRQEFSRSYPDLKSSFKKDGADKGYKIWEDRFDLVVVYSEPVLKTKIRYILLNPVRKELATTIYDWPYSSAINYRDPAKAVLPIEFISLDLE